MNKAEIIVFVTIIFGPLLAYALIRIGSSAYFAAKLEYHKRLIKDLNPEENKE